MRKMVDLLQALSLERKIINKKNVYVLAGKIMPEEIEEIFAGLEKTRNINMAISAVNRIIFRDGYDGLDVIEALIKYIQSSDATVGAKLFTYDYLAKVDDRLTRGARPHIQLYGYFTNYLKFTKPKTKK
jgi:DNA polymerase III delta prime subunit